MNEPIELLRQWWCAMDYRTRTVVPGLVDSTEDGTRERTANFQTGIADLEGGQASEPDITPDAPVLSFTGGGFFVLMPTDTGDEMLGLVVDRASGKWRTTRTAGQVDKVNGKRSKVLSDIMLTPFAITAPSGAPETWDGLTLGGPAGVAIEVATDGTVTITGQAVAPATPTKITMEPGGDITLEVGSANSVNVGGPAAVELPKWPVLESTIDALLAAGVAAGTGAIGTTGTLAFTAAQTAWNAAKSGIPTINAKGQ